jgi:hypothetical protein
MPHPSARKAYLITPTVNCGDDKAVYAVVSCDTAAAIAAVAATLGAAPDQLAFTGTLSRHTVDQLGLEPGEVRRI